MPEASAAAVNQSQKRGSAKCVPTGSARSGANRAVAVVITVPTGGARISVKIVVAVVFASIAVRSTSAKNVMGGGSAVTRHDAQGAGNVCIKLDLNSNLPHGYVNAYFMHTSVHKSTWGGYLKRKEKAFGGVE